MKKQKITKIIRTKDLDTNEETENKSEWIEITKNWEELTTEEKEKEIEKNSEEIYQQYQEDIYNNFLYDLEEIKEDFKNINFENIYLDSNSQGGWIDSVKNFKYQAEPIQIYGEDLDINEIDFKIRRYIEEITENDICIYDYYIDSEKLEKIQSTKKYQKWIAAIVQDVNNWIDRVNEAAAEVLKNEYSYPYNLNDGEDRYFLDNYFCDCDFTYTEEIEEKKNDEK